MPAKLSHCKNTQLYGRALGVVGDSKARLRFAFGKRQRGNNTALSGIAGIAQTLLNAYRATTFQRDLCDRSAHSVFSQCLRAYRRGIFRRRC